ncbi:MAG: hypothetical protein Q9160_004038 [Pyrenula sp. 1 TL-2023]
MARGLGYLLPAKRFEGINKAARRRKWTLADGATIQPHLHQNAKTFAELRKAKCALVDKSRYLLEFSNPHHPVKQIFAPTGFGKSLLLSTLHAFHDVAFKDDYKTLFGGLDIDNLVNFSKGHDHEDLNAAEYFRSRYELKLLDAKLAALCEELEDNNYNHMKPLKDLIGIACARKWIFPVVPNQYLTMCSRFGEMSAPQNSERYRLPGVEVNDFLTIINQGLRDFVTRHWKGLGYPGFGQIDLDHPGRVLSNLLDVERIVHESIDMLRKSGSDTKYGTALGIFILIDDCHAPLVSRLTPNSSAKTCRRRHDAVGKILEPFLQGIKNSGEGLLYGIRTILDFVKSMRWEREHADHEGYYGNYWPQIAPAIKSEIIGCYHSDLLSFRDQLVYRIDKAPYEVERLLYSGEFSGSAPPTEHRKTQAWLAKLQRKHRNNPKALHLKLLAGSLNVNALKIETYKVLKSEHSGMEEDKAIDYYIGGLGLAYAIDFEVLDTDCLDVPPSTYSWESQYNRFSYLKKRENPFGLDCP